MQVNLRKEKRVSLKHTCLQLYYSVCTHPYAMHAMYSCNSCAEHRLWCVHLSQWRTLWFVLHMHRTLCRPLGSVARMAPRGRSRNYYLWWAGLVCRHYLILCMHNFVCARQLNCTSMPAILVCNYTHSRLFMPIELPPLNLPLHL